MIVHLCHPFAGRNTYNGRLYKEDPTIFAWDILNEPRETSGNYGNVQKWIDTNAAYLKSVDPNHMVRLCPLSSDMAVV